MVFAKQQNTQNDDGVGWGKVASLFMICGLLSLATSWYYSGVSKTVLDTAFYPKESTKSKVLGPIQVSRFHESYNIDLTIYNMTMQSSSFIEGTVLDNHKKYLFSFGKDLWAEQGYDDEGAWSQMENTFDLNISFPKPGAYYLQFVTESRAKPESVSLVVQQKRGSGLPHLIFGVVLLLFGVVCNEIRSQTIFRGFVKMMDAEGPR